MKFMSAYTAAALQIPGSSGFCDILFQFNVSETDKFVRLSACAWQNAAHCKCLFGRILLPGQFHRLLQIHKTAAFRQDRHPFCRAGTDALPHHFVF